MYSAMGHLASPRWGCPIRRSPDHSLLAAPRGLSQPSTSFIGSWCQGIHRAPLLARRLDLSTSPSRQDQRSFKKTYVFCTTQSALGRRLSLYFCLLNYSSILQVHSPRRARKRPDVRRAIVAGTVSRLNDYAIDDSNLRMIRLSLGDSRDTRQATTSARPANIHYIFPRNKRASHVAGRALCALVPVEPRGFEPLTSAVQRRRSPN
jgi:hypothetical protein